MGERRRRRDRFFQEHPDCCFCGGLKPATTIDHVPSRATFAGKVGPDGFEFPSCEGCNGATSGSEQVFALYARLIDQNNANYDRAHSARLIQGVRNNHPEVLPNARLTANERRAAIRHWGIHLNDGQLLEDVPLIAIPKAVNRHIRVVGKKLLAALKYKHTGEFLQAEDSTFVEWGQQGLPGVDEALEQVIGGLPVHVVGQRVNTSIGDQFAYRYGTNEADGLFAFAAGFGAGALMIAATGPPELSKLHDEWVPYLPPLDTAADPAAAME